MRRGVRVFLALLLLAASSGCSPDGADEIGNLEDRVRELESELDAARSVNSTTTTVARTTTTRPPPSTTTTVRSDEEIAAINSLALEVCEQLQGSTRDQLNIVRMRVRSSAEGYKPSFEELDDAIDAECGDLVASLPTTTTTTLYKGDWVLEQGRSPTDDSPVVFISVTADEPVEGWLASATPELKLQCWENETNVIVWVGMGSSVEYGLYNQHTVQVRFDSDTAQEMRASEGTDSENLFLPNPIANIKKMLEHDTMLFAFVPYNANTQYTTFDIRGLQAHIGLFREACNW